MKKKTKVEVTKLDKEIKGWLMLKRQREGKDKQRWPLLKRNTWIFEKETDGW